jgi:ribosomal protein S18 acetylase RimI-like enzyme
VSVEVRRLRPDEGPRLKEVRLAALKDSPDAFWTKLAEAELYPDEEWERAARAAAKDEEAILIAEEGDRFIGMVGLFPDKAVEGAAHIWGMWVAPEYRGRKIGAALLDAAMDVAAGMSATSVRLEVVTTNESAKLLYEDRGFETVRPPFPFRSDTNPDLVQVEMAKDLTQ